MLKERGVDFDKAEGEREIRSLPSCDHSPLPPSYSPPVGLLLLPLLLLFLLLHAFP